MSIYGVTAYGTDVYGLSGPPTYLSEPMSAQASSYASILVTWNKPTGQIFRYRLLTSKYGFPVNENDGQVLIDSQTYPGSAYVHTPIAPGGMYYYAIYVLADVGDNIWIRSAVAATLAIANFGSAQWLMDRVPEYFKTIPEDGGELGGPSSGNTYLSQFLQVIGWGADFLKTQYALAANHMNDSNAMPLDNLLALAAELGLSFGPEIEASTIRKAVANASHAYRERGTYLGIRNDLILYTGWDADIQAGPNLLLEDDQAQMLNPVFAPYTSSRAYAQGEMVWTGTPTSTYGWSGTGYWYMCQVPVSYGVAPPGNGTTSTNWACIHDANDFLATLTNQDTGNPNTWEALDPAVSSGIINGSLTQGLGVSNLAGTGNAWNSLRVVNGATSAKTLMLRSVSRSTSDISLIPDPGFEAGFTIINSVAIPSPTWVGKSWPVIMVPMAGFPGQKNEPGKYNAAAFWTSATMELSRIGAAAHNGAWGVIATPTVTGNVFCGSPWFAVAATASVTASIWLKAPAALSHNSLLSIVWLDYHGNKISASSATSTSLVADTWAQVSNTATAPTGTKYAYIQVGINSAVPTDVFEFDDIAVSIGLAASPNYAPEQMNAVQDGIPVPWVRDSQVWDPSVSYGTGDIVLYQNQVFTALRSSVGAQPPTTNTATPEWSPLSFDRRIRLAISGYASQNMTASGNQTCPVTPFVEWFDSSGNFISRVFSRSAGAGARPGNLAFDSFTQPSSTRAGVIDIDGWAGSYFNNTIMSGNPVLQDYPDDLVFNWWSTSPGPNVTNSGWSAQWTASFTAPATATYTFGCASADGSRIIVNGVTVVNNWNAQPNTHATGTIALSNGQNVNVIVQYFKNLDTPVTTMTTTDFSSEQVQGWAGIAPVQVSWDSRGQLFYDSFMGLTSGTAISPMQPVTPLSTVTASADLTFDQPGASSGQAGEMVAYLVWLNAERRVTQINTGTPVQVTAIETSNVSVTGEGPEDAAYVLAVYTSLSLEGLTTSTSAPNWTTWGQYIGVSYQGNFIELFKYNPSTGVFWPVPVNSAGQLPLVNTSTGQIVGWTNTNLLDADDTCQILSATTEVTAKPYSGLIVDDVTWTMDGAYTSLLGRATDDRQYTWSVPVGAFMTCGYAGGSAAPVDPSARSIALVTGPANTQLGLTFRSAAPALTAQGLIFRYTDTNDYWRADQLGLWKNNAGSWSKAATWPTPFAPNDRMNITLNGSVITVYQNGVQVAQVTDIFNDGATQHGMIVETEGISQTTAGALAAATITATAGTVHAWPSASSLVETFATSDFGIVWNVATGISISSSAANIPCGPTPAVLSSISRYDLTNTAIYAHAGPSTGTDRELLFLLSTDVNNVIQIGYVGGSIQAQLKQNGVVTYLSPKVAYSDNYWRIRELAGMIYFDQSADSATWTNLWGVPYTMDVTRLQVQFSASYWATDTTTTAHVYGVNSAS